MFTKNKKATRSSIVLIQADNNHREYRLPKRGATNREASSQTRLILEIVRDHNNRGDQDERRAKA